MQNLTTVLDVTNYGVKGDGTTNNTKAIIEVVSKLESMGGGTIYFPPGEYVTGTIELKSNMTLYLEGGAVICGSADPEDYPMITEEILPGYARGGHSGLIKAFKADNVTVTGRGIVDGRGQNWWHNPANEHRPRAIQPILCNNLRISGITIKNSAMWTVHPICCTNVTIDGITIKNPANSPNTDGINPESCSNVHISNCHVDVGDDCVTLKSGTEDDIFQKQYPCENITITNCTMINGHGGVVIGSEMSGGVRNVTISNCVFNGTDRGIRIKTRRKRGGIVEDIRVNNIMMVNVFSPLVINGYYQCGASEDDMELFSLEKRDVREDTPIFRNIYISNVTARNVVASAGYLYGIPEMPIENLVFDNVVIEMRDTDEEVREKPIMAYHVQKTKGQGFYCANVKDVQFKNVWINTVKGPALELENSEKISVNGLIMKEVHKDSEVIKVKNSKEVFITGSRLNPEAEVFVTADSVSAEDIVLSGNYIDESRQKDIKINA